MTFDKKFVENLKINIHNYLEDETVLNDINKLTKLELYMSIYEKVNLIATHEAQLMMYEQFKKIDMSKIDINSLLSKLGK